MLPTTVAIGKEVNTLMLDFLWSGKVSRAHLELPVREGGLGLHNFANRFKASKISWVKKAVGLQYEPWPYYFE